MLVKHLWDLRNELLKVIFKPDNLVTIFSVSSVSWFCRFVFREDVAANQKNQIDARKKTTMNLKMGGSDNI